MSDTSFRAAYAKERARGARTLTPVCRIGKALRLVAVTSAITLAVDLAVAYWWLCFGPFPEDALNLID